MRAPECIDSGRDNVAVTTAPQPAVPGSLRPCGCGAAFLPHRITQQFCSRRCAVRARPARAVQKRRPQTARPHHEFILRLLDIQPLERRARGGWRFGTKVVGDSLAARLIASGRAEIRDNRLHRKHVEARS
ncbi:hypothetical protein [Bradyrhizobium sp. WSM4349]|uniref:hypothetical protein n=1 Tax=Bradyrhizobium sp. WSM4349 TaxID=1040988 RepID=UPI0012F9004D|nr:hypothetical protein [Bradyrhizobium sp. WSM4349]